MKSLYLWLGAATFWRLFLQLAALPVYFPNLSVKMTTNQSTTFDQYGKSDYAVDGIIEIESEYLEHVQSCIATQIENSPWWMVDLGGIFQIEVVIITNKLECWGDMLSEVELTIGFREDDPLSTRQVCYRNLSHMSKGRIEVHCNQWPYYFFGRYFFLSIPKNDWFLSFCEVEVYSKIPYGLEERGVVFDSQSGTWRPSVWLAVERFQNYLYMNVSLDSGSTKILYVPPAQIYPDTPVHMGALDIDDTVLAPFSWSLTGEPVYSKGTVKGMQDQLIYQVQSTSDGSVKHFNYSVLRHKDSCKLQTKCPTNSECTRMLMNEKFATFDYMCKCRAGYLSSMGNFLGVINENISEVCKGGVNLAGGKPTNQSDTLGDAVSSRAVDGNIDSRFYDGKSCSSTTKHANAWWRVDLGKLEFVAHVFIQFRYDCCDSEATQFVIHVGSYLEDHFPVIGQEFKNYICSSFTVTNIRLDKGWHVHCGKTIAGRYVYIRLLENHRLTLCEVYVYSENSDNIAFAQPDYFKAVDGDLNTCLNVTTASSLRIDLLYVRPVALVHVLSAVNVTDMVVTVGMDQITGESCMSSDGMVIANVMKEYVCNYPNRRRGRYVSVTITHPQESLNLCEVLVYAGYEYDLTWMGSATQSSYFVPEMHAKEAFDDDRVTCTATKEETDPWWKIDLGGNHSISEVVIYTDNTLPHSSQYDVFVDQQLCGVANLTGRQLLSVICNPEAHGKVITINCTGANKMVALCEVELFSKVHVGYDDVCQSPYLCHSNNTCRTTAESYTCECPPGKYPSSSQNIVDPACLPEVDECLSPDACRSGLVCNNTVGSYRCECPLGYTEDPDFPNDMNPVCIDVDECQLSLDSCRPEFNCKNTIGSYRCLCSVGFTPDPSSQNDMEPVCVDVDECANNVESLGCSPMSDCINFVGSYFCACKEGYLGDGRTCQEMAVVFEMICQNRGGVQQTCDQNGSFRCKCAWGYVYDSETNTCQRTC